MKPRSEKNDELVFAEDPKAGDLLIRIDFTGGKIVWRDRTSDVRSFRMNRPEWRVIIPNRTQSNALEMALGANHSKLVVSIGGEH